MKQKAIVRILLAVMLIGIVIVLGASCVVTQQNEYTVIRQF